MTRSIDQMAERARRLIEDDAKAKAAEEARRAALAARPIGRLRPPPVVERHIYRSVGRDTEPIHYKTNCWCRDGA